MKGANQVLVILLALLAAASLLSGYLMDEVSLVWVALGLSIGMLTLVVGTTVVERRGPRPEQGAATEEADAVDSSSLDDEDDGDPTGSESVREPAEVTHPSEAGASTTVARDDAPSSDADDGLVRVIEGRRRYHRADCELLGQHETELLTEEEALEEGFSACSRCRS